MSKIEVKLLEDPSKGPKRHHEDNANDHSHSPDHIDGNTGYYYIHIILTIYNNSYSLRYDLSVRVYLNMVTSKYKVKLTETERAQLNVVGHKGKSSARTVKRALALLKTDQGLSDSKIAEALR